MQKHLTVAVVGLALLASFAARADSDSKTKPATAATIAAQKQALASLPQEDGRDEKWARQGFIATLDDPATRRADGGIAYDPNSTRFVDDGKAPSTVHPALWRHQRLLRIHGLFQVSEN